MRVIFMGTPSYAVTILDKLIKENYNIVGVFTQPDKVVGRKKILTPPDVKNYILKNNLNIGDSDVVNYCRNLINDCNCEIVRIGKNWYCKLNNICITVNAYSFTIITAHIIK